MDRAKHLNETQPFYDAVMKIETMDECREFFEDICTPAELSAIAQRMHISKMLLDGSTYVEIQAETGASTMLISRTQTMLRSGHQAVENVLSRCSDSQSTTRE